MKKLKGLLVLVLLLALIASPLAVLASDISTARYYGTIIVSNNSTATTNVSVNCTILTSALIDGGYLNSSANNCAVRSSAGADLPFMPSVNASYPWAIWVPTIGENAHLSDLLYMADSTGGEIRYFPGDAGMATADNTTLELGDNFTVEQKGWIDTDAGSDKNLILKPSAFRVYVSSTVSGNITASFTAGATENQALTINGPGDETGSFEIIGAATQWQAVATDNAAYIRTDNTSYVESSFALIPFTAQSGNISSVTVTFKIRMQGAGTGYATPKLRLDGVDSDGTQQSKADQAFATFTQTITRPGGGSWAQGDFGDLQVGIKLKGTGAEALVCSYLYVTVYYTPEVSISATGVSSGEHIVVTAMDTPFLSIGVDAGSDIPPIGASLELNAPMWQTELNADPFTSIDGTEYSCDVVNNVTWTSLGYDFAGTNDYIEIPADNTTASLLNFTSGDFSIEFWVKIDSVPQTWSSIFYRGLLDTDGYMLFILNGDLFLRTNKAAANQQTTGGDFTLGAWHHGVATRQGAVVKIYQNGVDVTEAAGTHLNPATCARTAKMGVRDDKTTRELDGLFGEFRVYSQALFPAEVLQNYNATKFKYSSGDITTYSTLASVPDNSANWTFCKNNALPYLEYQEITIGGVLQQDIEWEYDTTFTDLSGNSHDAIPTFRTTSSDADVSAVLTSFLPVAEAKAPSYALEDAPAFIETVPTIVSTWVVTPGAGPFPLAGVITAIANATDTPAQLPLLIIAAFVIIACSLAVSAAMRRYGSGSLIAKVIAITALMGVFIAIDNFGIDFWMLFVFLVIAIALSMGSKQVRWQ